MPVIWLDVDTILTEVPINLLALIDDTDFKSREESLVYNQAGLDLVWNFVTSAGVYTQTSVTPTTGGDYDWTNQGNGMYSIGIKDTGGADINNDTEGYGWFTGFATGVLPWSGPVIGFRAAAINDALCDGGDTLDVNAVSASAAFFQDFFTVNSGQVSGSEVSGSAILEIAKVVWDRVLSGATHTIGASAGRRLRGVQEFQGYEDGAVWIDIVNGTSGTTPYENGVVGTPVNNMADANTIAAAVNLSRFRIAPNSTITLAAAQENQVFIGNRWTLALGGQSVSGSFFSGADVSGIGTGAAEIRFEHCHFGNVTLPPSDMERCVLEGTFTIGSEGDFFFENCSSGVAGASTPILDFGSARNSSDVNIRNYSGGLEIQYIGENTGTYNLSFDCPAGQIVFNVNCSATSIIELRGNHRRTNNATGLTINEDARIDVAQIKSEIVDALNVDTYAEPGQEAPGTTITLVDKIGYLYKTLRNKKDQTSSMFQLYNDGGTTVDQKSTVAFADGTVTKGELATGP